jgi:hypothetical protein
MRAPLARDGHNGESHDISLRITLAWEFFAPFVVKTFLGSEPCWSGRDQFSLGST